MLVNSQANADEIQRLNDLNEDNKSEMEKLKLEMTVVLTEKQALQKELNRIEMLYN